MSTPLVRCRVVRWEQHVRRVPKRVQHIGPFVFPVGYETVGIYDGFTVTLECGHEDQGLGEVPDHLFAEDMGDWPCLECSRALSSTPEPKP